MLLRDVFLNDLRWFLPVLSGERLLSTTAWAPVGGRVLHHVVATTELSLGCLGVGRQPLDAWLRKGKWY